MARFARWTLGVLAVWAALAAAGAVLWLEPYLESEAFRQRAERNAREALGLDVAYERLDLLWLPLGIDLKELRVTHAGPRPDPFLEARSARARIALLPLLVGRLVFDGLTAEGAILTLIREGDALRVPKPQGTASPGSSTPSANLALLPAHLSIREGRIIYLDRSLTPPDSFQLDQVEVDLRADFVEARLRLKATALLPGGGRLAAEGEIDRKRRSELALSVEEAELEGMPWVRRRLAQAGLGETRGRIDGTGRARTTEGRLTSLEGQITWSQGGGRFGSLALAGQLEMAFEVAPQSTESGRLEFGLDLDRGGRLTGRGGLRTDGPRDLELDLDHIALAPFIDWIPDAREIGGVASGRVTISGPAREPSAVHADLEVDAATYVGSGVVVRGPVTLDLELGPGVLRGSGPPGEAARVSADLTAASFNYQRMSKPPGVEGRVSGRLVRGADGILSFEIEALRLGGLDLSGEVRREKAEDGVRTRIVVRAAPFDVASLVGLVPDLGEWRQDGRARIDELDVTFDPLRLVGEVGLEEVGVRVLDGYGTVSGRIVFEGDHAVGEAMRLVVGEQPLVGHVRLDGIESELVVQSRLVNDGPLDAQRFITGLLGRPGVIEGPLAIELEVSHNFALPLLEGLAARLVFRVGGEYGTGRIPRVSWFERLTHSNELLGVVSGGAEYLTSILRPQESFSRYYGDEFDLLDARARFESGLFHYESVRIVYPFYTVSLSGVVDGATGALNLEGALTLFEQRRRAESEAPPQGLDVPLASVRGTIADPRIAVGPGGVDLLMGFVFARAAGTKVWNVVADQLRRPPANPN